MPKIITQEEAKRRSDSVGIKIIGKYVSATEKIAFECPYCNSVFLSRPGHIWRKATQSCGCNKNRLTQKEAKQISLSIGIKMTGEYKGNNIPTSFECPYCKIIFVSKPNSVWTKNTKSCGCLAREHSKQLGLMSGLVKENNSLAEKLPNIASEWHPIKNGKLTPDQLNYKSRKRVWWQCIFGHEWETTVGARSQRKKTAKCPICSGRRVLLGFNDLQTKNSTLCEEWDYSKNKLKPTEIIYCSKKYVWWKCRICKNSWRTSLRTRMLGHGCPFCNSSKGEQEILLVLKKYNISYIREKSFENLVSKLGNPLRFDFYLQNFNTLLEYQGQQHYKENKWYSKKSQKQTLYHDKLKRQYCKDNNLKLLEISYKDFDKIEEILLNFIAKNSKENSQENHLKCENPQKENSC